MWVMAWMVWRKLLSGQSILILALCILALGIIAFDSDADLLDSAEKNISRGYFVVSILVNLAVIFIGGTQLAMEISDRTAMFWLSRPLRRWQFVTGKFIGANIMGWMLLALLGGSFLAMFAARGLPVCADYFRWLAADALRVMVLAALMTCLSTGMGYMPAAMIGGFLALAGMATFVLPLYCRLLEATPVSWLLWGIYLLLPNWHHFDFGLEIRGGSVVYWLALLVYTAALSWLYLAAAIIFFRNRDLA